MKKFNRENTIAMQQATGLSLEGCKNALEAHDHAVTVHAATSIEDLKPVLLFLPRGHGLALFDAAEERMAISGKDVFGNNIP